MLVAAMLVFGLGRDSRTANAAGLPPLPARWPFSSLQLGTGDAPGGAAAMKSVAPFGFRYQYLAGGANTGSGWATWNANGQFASYYVQDSVSNGITPVFTYYMIRQSAPGNIQGEVDGVYNNLQNASTMNAYWNDLKLLFQRVNGSASVVLHVEPDLWGYIEQRSTSDNAASVSAKVGSAGVAELAGLPDNMAGFAQAVVKLRNIYAPNVFLGYHLSVWGTGIDINLSNTSDTQTDALATRAATFYNSLSAPFDVAFAEFSDRDAAFKQYVYGDGGASWWDAADFARDARFDGRFVALTGKRIVKWQIPLGNTRMLAENNTWNHYQDNRVEWLLDDSTQAHLSDYVNAGVVAFLFGGGASGTTCACDANGDGITNPAPINGNRSVSLNADDDGGFFKAKAQAYYQAGAMTLGGTSGTATPISTSTSSVTASPTRTNTPASTPTQTSTPTATPSASITPPPTAGWATSGRTSATSVSRRGSITINAAVVSGGNSSALIDVEVYGPSGQKLIQKYWDNQSFAAGIARTFGFSWSVPSTAPRGTYTVKIGVFSVGWGTVFAWNDRATTFIVK